MAYDKLNLENGNILTAEHLAHIEQGIEDATNNASNGGSTVDLLDENGRLKAEVLPLGYAKSTTIELPRFELTSSDFIDTGEGMFVTSKWIPMGNTISHIRYKSNEYFPTVMEEEGMTVFGNPVAFGGDDNGDPFTFILANSYSNFTSLYIPLDGSSSPPVISIYFVKDTPMLPSYSGFYMVITATISSNGDLTHIENVTGNVLSQDFLTAFYTGTPINATLILYNNDGSVFAAVRNTSTTLNQIEFSWSGSIGDGVFNKYTAVAVMSGNSCPQSLRVVAYSVTPDAII